MGHFAESLVSLMEIENIDQLALAKSTGFSQTTISRIAAGREPTQEQVGLICAAISQDRERRLELLISRLKDVAEAGKIAGLDERHYILGPATSSHSDVIHASGSLASDLQLIADECANHKDVREMIGQISNMIMRTRAELADAQGATLKFQTGVGELPES